MTHGMSQPTAAQQHTALHCTAVAHSSASELSDSDDWCILDAADAQQRHHCTAKATAVACSTQPYALTQTESTGCCLEIQLLLSQPLRSAGVTH
eukprot:17294-Heterococcus_DN1.PRE.1